MSVTERSTYAESVSFAHPSKRVVQVGGQGAPPEAAVLLRLRHPAGLPAQVSKHCSCRHAVCSGWLIEHVPV